MGSGKKQMNISVESKAFALCAVVAALANMRKVDTAKLCQAVNAWRGSAKVSGTESDTGSAKSRKNGTTEWDESIKVSMRADTGVVGQFVSWHDDVAKLDIRAGKKHCTITVTDWPASVTEWVGKFIPALPKMEDSLKAAKAAKAAKATAPVA